MAEATSGALEQPRSTNRWIGAMPSLAGLHEAEELAMTAPQASSLYPLPFCSPTGAPPPPAPWSLFRDQSLIRPCSVAPSTGSWSTALPRPHTCFPGAPSPPHPAPPVTWGSFSGPHLNLAPPGLYFCPPKSTFASVSHAHTLWALSSSLPRTSLLFAFLVIRGAQGHRASEGPQPDTAFWTMPLLCHGDPCFPNQ